MEVDDALVSTSLMEKEMEKMREENGGSNSRTSGRRLKLTAETAEDPPGDGSEPDELENRGSQSSLATTPFKLEVTASEIEEEEEMGGGEVTEATEEADDFASTGKKHTSRMAIRRKLVRSSTQEEVRAAGGGGSGGGAEQLGELSLKRKRYAIRRSGSEECLLGFDEKSGEAELIKVDEEEEEEMHDDQKADEEQEQLEQLLEEQTTAESPDVGADNVRVEQTGAAAASASASADEKEAAPTSPMSEEEKVPVAETQNNKYEKEATLTPHIVADAEELNGSASANAAPGSNAARNAGNSSAPGAAPAKKVLSIHDEFYRKPFEYGWKRELVWRANMETSKDKADVYFITPAGKKLRARSEIVPLLEGDLTIDHFCFAREPLGAGPEFETVRNAKPSTRVSVTAATLAAAPTLPNMGKRISKPKGPKGASPPPEGWTPTRALKVNNALLSSSGFSRHSHGAGSSGAHPSTPPSGRRHHHDHSHNHGHSHSRDYERGGSSSHSTKTGRAKKPAAATPSGSTPPAVAKAPSGNAVREPCTMACQRALGQVPQLQCVKCLCLFHHECVGLSRQNSEYRVTGRNTGREYVCEACSPVGTAAPSPVNAAPKTKVAPGRSDSRPENKFPQTIAVVKGKKYVMVAKPLAPPSEHVNDIENDLKQINESIRNSRKPSAASLDAAFQPHSSASSAAVEHSNKLFAMNFFANVSFAYDALLCILKYLKIHERPRAAAVCKLWHLAAKDTSLWQTVRMKNSKVCSWSGFAAALRRGETKHLDLRKMLLTSARSEDMWTDFSEHIGTVCTLEAIDLCRCSARVVESLFQSNKQLRVLNALAINDDTISLEHIGLLRSLEELRLRTCEPGVIAGDLLPLASLTQLSHLSLTSIRGLGTKSVEVLGGLSGLRSLELGECGDFDSTLAENVLPKLKNLQRLRLENGQVTNCCTLEILESVACLEKLQQLELVNFDIKPGFDEKLSQCTNIRKLLIIPTYISQSATTNHIVLSAVQQVADTLSVFTWGVTVELLRVTALYVDQCEESTKKEKHHFDECIPVLKPVPGAPPAELDDDGESGDEADAGARSKTHQTEDDDNASEVPQIEILPLDKVESILSENLPHTKFTIVKVPYLVTCKQQMVE